MELQEAIDFIDHPNLKQSKPGSWADFGCGDGLFTYALASLLPESSTIYAVDRSYHQMNKDFYPPHVDINFLLADFTMPQLALPGLQGILMANSLHYVKDKPAFLKQLKEYLQTPAHLLIVEYDTQRSNPWVPFPVHFSLLKKLLHSCGFNNVEKLRTRASIYDQGNMYVAMAST